MGRCVLSSSVAVTERAADFGGLFPSSGTVVAPLALPVPSGLSQPSLLSGTFLWPSLQWPLLPPSYSDGHTELLLTLADLIVCVWQVFPGSGAGSSPISLACPRLVSAAESRAWLSVGTWHVQRLHVSYPCRWAVFAMIHVPKVDEFKPVFLLIGILSVVINAPVQVGNSSKSTF